jgi:hypothetical protein
MKIAFTIMLFTTMALFCISCATIPRYGLESNQPVPATAKKGAAVEGEACGWLLFNFIPLNVDASARTAMNNAESKASGKPLIDVTVDQKLTWYIVVSKVCTIARGFTAE